MQYKIDGIEYSNLDSIAAEYSIDREIAMLRIASQDWPTWTTSDMVETTHCMSPLLIESVKHLLSLRTDDVSIELLAALEQCKEFPNEPF